MVKLQKYIKGIIMNYNEWRFELSKIYLDLSLIKKPEIIISDCTNIAFLPSKYKFFILLDAGWDKDGVWFEKRIVGSDSKNISNSNKELIFRIDDEANINTLLVVELDIENNINENKFYLIDEDNDLACSFLKIEGRRSYSDKVPYNEEIDEFQRELYEESLSEQEKSYDPYYFDYTDDY